MASIPCQVWRRITLRQISHRSRCYASLATAQSSTPIDHTPLVPPITIKPNVFPSTQPPSHRRPDFRKSQILRQYVSMLRSSEMMLIFQHNSVLANEYMAIRRALKSALEKVDETQNTQLADHIKLVVVKTGIFDMAMRIIKFWDPIAGQQGQSIESQDAQFTHALSEAAYEASKNRKRKHGLEKLLSGPIAILTIPTSSPAHLAAALSVLSPSPEFPAPRKKVNPAYHDPAVQIGIPKLMLLGARMESKNMDLPKVFWVGSLHGGLEGLRAQLVQTLQGLAAGIPRVLEAASTSLWGTLEGRKTMLEEEENKNKAA